MAETDAPAFSIWHCRALGPDGAPVWFAVVQSSTHADGTVVELPESDALIAIGSSAVGFARVGPDGGLDRLEVTEDSAPQAPPLWFVQLDEPDAMPLPAVTLLAFTGHGIEPGTLLDHAGARRAGVKSDDQVAAFRWYPGSGFGDQVYVAPQWRRRTIGSGILAAGGTLAFARGWSRLWGDGQRTAEGNKMRDAGRWSHMSEELTHLMPPMTPEDEREQ